jgi:hypothetical protein
MAVTIHRKIVITSPIGSAVVIFHQQSSLRSDFTMRQWTTHLHALLTHQISSKGVQAVINFWWIHVKKVSSWRRRLLLKSDA